MQVNYKMSHEWKTKMEKNTKIQKNVWKIYRSAISIMACNIAWYTFIDV